MREEIGRSPSQQRRGAVPLPTSTGRLCCSTRPFHLASSCSRALSTLPHAGILPSPRPPLGEVQVVYSTHVLRPPALTCSLAPISLGTSSPQHSPLSPDPWDARTTPTAALGVPFPM